MTGYRVSFQAPYLVRTCRQERSSVGPGELLLATRISGISAGTELLFYRGELPEWMPVDPSIPSLSGTFAYPISYGYSVAGTVIEIGKGVAESWLGCSAFAFSPHQSYVVVPATEAVSLPSELAPEVAIFIPNLETAVNLVMDGAPLFGERVVVLGQGIVGLLVTALLSRFPLGLLVSFDRYPSRRQAAEMLGNGISLDPDDQDAVSATRHALAEADPGGADLVFELTGQPAALDLAIELAGFGARVVVGSWYGSKSAPINLGGHFHRRRLRLISSQVSTVAPELTGRWTKERRFASVLHVLPQLDLARLISHRFPVERAAEAFELLDRRPEQALQVVLEYPEP